MVISYWDDDERSTSPNTIYFKFNTIGDVVKLTSKKLEGLTELKLFKVIVE